jgi:alanine or glycine:cation symporter, AGCS family
MPSFCFLLAALRQRTDRFKGVHLCERELFMLEKIATVNGVINGFVWGIPMLILLVGTGILMTNLTGWFQLSHFGYWWKKTVGGILHNKEVTEHTSKEDRQITQFQSLCTALAATIGTGNIAGVAAAIASGGPGSIFWMWVVAFFGMMTNYSENVLGIFYRRRNSKGEWCGGAMYYLKDGLGSKKYGRHIGPILAVLFSIFCVLASFGIGNMSQVNSIAVNVKSAFGIPTLWTGIFLMVIAGVVILGGLKRIASVTEMLVPFMAIAYVVLALIVVLTHASMLPAAVAAIFKGAFAMKAVGGGIVGAGVKQAVTWGMKRGVFSNEAGLGSSVMVHSTSNVKEPVMQGMWGIFEVFADTIVVCSLTAFAILCSGVVNLENGTMISDAEKTALVSEAFGKTYGAFGAKFIAVAILLFAFSTVLGWSIYGTKAIEYLLGEKAVVVYKAVFVVFIVCGATMNLELAWDLSDTFNGLMAIPNLIGVLVLSGTVRKITKNYVDRNFRGKEIAPMYSAFPDVQEAQEQDM